MKNTALPRKENDRICKIGGTYRDPAVGGPLSYGRNNPPADTEVWKANSETRVGERQGADSFLSLETALDFVFEVQRRIIRNSLIVRSVAMALDTPKGRVFRYTYSLRNGGKDVPVVSWEIPGLMERVKKDSDLKSLIRSMANVEGLMIKDSVDIPFTDGRVPIVGAFPIYFLDPDGKRIGGGSADAYIPK